MMKSTSSTASNSSAFESKIDDSFGSSAPFPIKNSTDTMESAQQQEESSCFSCGQCWEFVSSTVCAMFEAVINFFSGLMGQDKITEFEKAIDSQLGVERLQAMLALANYARSLPEGTKKRDDCALILSGTIGIFSVEELQIEDSTSNMEILLFRELNKDSSVLGGRINFALTNPLHEAVSKAIEGIINTYGEAIEAMYKNY